MKLKIKKSILKSALSYCNRVISNKPIIPANANFAIVVKNNSATIRGMSAEITVFKTVDAIEAEDVAFGVNATDFLRLVSSIQQPELTINVDVENKQSLEIKTETGKYKLYAEKIDDYPSIEMSKDEKLAIVSAEEFHNAMSGTKPFATEDALMQGLGFICIDVDRGNFVGSSKFNMSIYSCKTDIKVLDSKSTHKTVLVKPVLADLLSGTSDDIIISDTGNMFCFTSSNNVKIFHAKTSETYPDYTKLNREHLGVVSVEKDILMNKLSPMTIFTSATDGMATFTFHKGKGIEILAEDRVFGREATEFIPCNPSLQCNNIALNINRLMLILRSRASNSLDIHYSAPNMPISINGDDNILSHLMPLVYK